MPEDSKRLGILETKMENYERRLEIQENKSDRLNDITTYLELQYKHNKTQDEKIQKMNEQFEQITIVLDSMSTNLMSLNHDVKFVKDKQENMDGRVEELEQKELEELKRLQAERQENKTKIIVGVVTGVVVAIISSVAILWLGLG